MSQPGVVAEFWYVDCANCGKQVLIDGLASKCLWCHKNATKKEVTMQEHRETARPKKGKKAWEYFEQNKEAILSDYHSMKVQDFFESWRISSTTWMKLKKLWEVARKQRGRGDKPVKRPETDDTEALTEHERYLMLLGYQMAVRDFLRSEK